MVVLATSGRASFAQSLVAGPEFRVNSGRVGDQSKPRVAVDAADNFLVVWSGDRAGAQRFDRAGQRLGGELSIGPFALDVEVGMNGAGDFVAASLDSEWGPLSVRMFAPDGTAKGGAVKLEGNAFFGVAVKAGG